MFQKGEECKPRSLQQQHSRALPTLNSLPNSSLTTAAFPRAYNSSIPTLNSLLNSSLTTAALPRSTPHEVVPPREEFPKRIFPRPTLHEVVPPREEFKYNVTFEAHLDTLGAFPHLYA